jgi:hypothetical protein
MTFFYEKGIYPRIVQDFTNAKSKDYWKDFEHAAELINSNPNIDYKMLIDALASTYKNRFDPGLLHHSKGMKIYNGYVKIRNATVKTSDIESIIKSDMMNVISEAVKYDIDNINDYMNYNRDIIPLMALNYGSGLISSFFLASIPDIMDVLQDYPQDIRDEYFDSFISEYKNIKDKILRSSKNRIIFDNFYEIMDSAIKKSKMAVIVEIANNQP